MSQMIDFTVPSTVPGPDAPRVPLCPGRAGAGHRPALPRHGGVHRPLQAAGRVSGCPGHPRHGARPSGPRRLHPHQSRLRLLCPAGRQPRRAGRPARHDRADENSSTPDVPYFLLGHSMGSFYARQYLCEWGSELAGAIIMGTGFQPKALVAAGKNHLPGAGRLLRLAAPQQAGGQPLVSSATTRVWRAAPRRTGSTATPPRWTSTAPMSVACSRSP